MTVTPIQNVCSTTPQPRLWRGFRPCLWIAPKFRSAVPEIIANLIIQAAKDVSAMPRTSLSEYLCRLAAKNPNCRSQS